ncbi:MAG: hypothetical protein FWH26_10110 [Oscillospiraceae bacterium]|nr:hypothetical protein [Oscillospiraceae bacterium]
MTHTKKTALCGVFAGLSLALLWVFSFIPSLEYALPAAAGMLILCIVLEVDRLWALMAYAVSAVLAMLLLPEKTVPLLYTLFFGYFPVLKSLLEQRLPRLVEIPVKFAVFNATMIAVYYIGTFLFGLEFDDFGEKFGQYAPWVLLALGNLIFVIYDFMVLNNFIRVYRRHWQKRLRKLL